MKYIGAMSGLVFGIAGILVSIFGLVSYVAEIASMLLMPFTFLFRMSGLYFPGMMVAGLLLNVLLFALIGHLMHRYLEKSGRGRYVVYAFIAVMALVILLIIAEALIWGLSA